MKKETCSHTLSVLIQLAIRQAITAWYDASSPIEGKINRIRALREGLAWLADELGDDVDGRIVDAVRGLKGCKDIVEAWHQITEVLQPLIAHDDKILKVWVGAFAPKWIDNALSSMPGH